MSMYAFKCAEYRGVVTASNMKNLFWAIDEYMDPYQVEIRKISEISMCWNIGVDEVDTGPDEIVDYTRTELEIGERSIVEVEWCQDGWRKVDWRKYV